MAARLEAWVAQYCPKDVTAAQWAVVAEDVRCVVRRSAPVSLAVAQGRTILLGRVARAHLEHAEVLGPAQQWVSTEALNRYLQRCAAGQTQRTLASVHAYAKAVLAAAQQRPHAAGNEPQTGAVSRRIQVTPSQRTQTLIGALTSPAPVTGVLAAHAVNYWALEAVVAHLPAPTPEGFTAALRGTSTESPRAGGAGAGGRTRPVQIRTFRARFAELPVASDKRVSKSAARRAARKAAQTVQAEPAPLAQPLADYLERFQPQSVPREDLPQVRPAVVAVMRRATHLGGVATFTKHVVDVTSLVHWAHRGGRDLGWQSLMDHAVIADYARAEHSGASPRTIAHRADRLRRLASRINPGPTAMPLVTTTAYACVQPPYSEQEMAQIVSIVTTQPSPTIRRRVSALVALARGAGATPGELRTVTGRHIVDHGDAGIDVTLTRDGTTRVVPLRAGWEPLLRAGIEGVPPGGLVVAVRTQRTNVVHALLSQVVALGQDAPVIDAQRLRTTWIADLMCSPVPLHALLSAAGLRSARTISEIHAHLLDDPAAYRGAIEALRGGQS